MGMFGRTPAEVSKRATKYFHGALTLSAAEAIVMFRKHFQDSVPDGRFLLRSAGNSLDQIMLCVAAQNCFHTYLVTFDGRKWAINGVPTTCTDGSISALIQHLASVHPESKWSTALTEGCEYRKGMSYQGVDPISVGRRKSYAQGFVTSTVHSRTSWKRMSEPKPKRKPPQLVQKERKEPKKEDELDLSTHTIAPVNGELRVLQAVAKAAEENDASKIIDKVKPELQDSTPVSQRLHKLTKAFSVPALTEQSQTQQELNRVELRIQGRSAEVRDKLRRKSEELQATMTSGGAVDLPSGKGKNFSYAELQKSVQASTKFQKPRQERVFEDAAGAARFKNNIRQTKHAFAEGAVSNGAGSTWAKVNPAQEIRSVAANRPLEVLQAVASGDIQNASSSVHTKVEDDVIDNVRGKARNLASAHTKGAVIHAEGASSGARKYDAKATILRARRQAKEAQAQQEAQEAAQRSRQEAEVKHAAEEEARQRQAKMKAQVERDRKLEAKKMWTQFSKSESSTSPIKQSVDWAYKQT